MLLGFIEIFWNILVGELNLLAFSGVILSSFPFLQMSRMYTIPLYEDLCTGTLKSFALEIFYQTQNQLHPNLRKTIQQILSQGLNPLPAIDTTAGTADTPAMVLEDKVSEATNGAISLRDVNVSA